MSTMRSAIRRKRRCTCRHARSMQPTARGVILVNHPVGHGRGGERQVIALDDDPPQQARIGEAYGRSADHRDRAFDVGQQQSANGTSVSASAPATRRDQYTDQRLRPGSRCKLQWTPMITQPMAERSPQSRPRCLGLAPLCGHRQRPLRTSHPAARRACGRVGQGSCRCRLLKASHYHWDHWVSQKPGDSRRLRSLRHHAECQEQKKSEPCPAIVDKLNRMSFNIFRCSHSCTN
jgi:hypothetical protein